MDYKRINRLNEDHDEGFRSEILNMTVGEMLDKVATLDTQGDAEYEVIEDVLHAINDKLFSGYDADDGDIFNPEDTVEAPSEIPADEVDHKDNEGGHDYSDITSSDAGNDKGDLDFQF